jgi:hypothetical protein
MILHTCEPISGFLFTRMKEINDITHLRTTISFLHSHGKKKEIILHICKATNGFLHSHKRRKEMILHICGSTSDFFIHTIEKKSCCTYVSL